MTSAATATAGVAMVLAGVGIPVMAMLNGAFGARFGPASAAIVTFAIALAGSIIVALAQGGQPAKAVAAAPWHMLLPGIVVAYYMLSITTFAPRDWIGNGGHSGRSGASTDRGISRPSRAFGDAAGADFAAPFDWNYLHRCRGGTGARIARRTAPGATASKRQTPAAGPRGSLSVSRILVRKPVPTFRAVLSADQAA